MTAEMNPTEQGALDIRWPGRSALLLAIGLASFSMSGINPILPAITAHFSADPHAGFIARLLVTIVGVAIAIGAPVVGILADRFGSRLMLLTGLLVYGIAGSAGYFVDDLYLLLAARAVTGLAAAAIGATVFALIATRSHGAARNHWIGYVSTAGAFSVAALMPIVGIVSTHGWRAVFLMHAIALPILAIALIGLEPDRRLDRARDTASATPAGPLPIGLLAMTLASGVLAMAPLLYVPFHMKNIGIDASYISIAMIPVTFFSATGSFLYGRVRARLSVTAVFALSFALLAAGALGNAFATDLSHILIAQTMLGCGEGLVFVNQYALAAQTGSPAQRARMMGFTKGGLCAGPMIGQLALEPVVAAAGVEAALKVLGMAAILMMLAHAWRLRFASLRTVAA